MHTAPSSDDVMTYREIAAFTGLSENALHNRQFKGGMPAPDGQFKGRPYWMRETILRWAPNGRPDPRPRRTRSDKGVPRGPRQATAAA